MNPQTTMTHERNSGTGKGEPWRQTGTEQAGATQQEKKVIIVSQNDILIGDSVSLSGTVATFHGAGYTVSLDIEKQKYSRSRRTTWREESLARREIEMFMVEYIEMINGLAHRS